MSFFIIKICVVEIKLGCSEKVGFLIGINMELSFFINKKILTGVCITLFGVRPSVCHCD